MFCVIISFQNCCERANFELVSIMKFRFFPSFSYHQIGTNIPAYLENVKNKQPFVLVLGARVKPEQVFVIIEREAIPQDSLLKAVDLCFKCFYVYDIDYPWQTCNSWQFLQSAIFGIEGIAKATSSSVMSLKAFLKIKRKPEKECIQVSCQVKVVSAHIN